MVFGCIVIDTTPETTIMKVMKGVETGMEARVVPWLACWPWRLNEVKNYINIMYGYVSMGKTE